MKIKLITIILWYISIFLTLIFNLGVIVAIREKILEIGYSNFHNIFNLGMIQVLSHLAMYSVLFLQNAKLLKHRHLNLSETFSDHFDSLFKIIIRWATSITSIGMLISIIYYSMWLRNETIIVGLIVMIFFILNLYHSVSLIVIGYKFRKQRKIHEQTILNFGQTYTLENNNYE